jgi:hypothetical protein
MSSAPTKKTGFPVEDFPQSYEWYEGDWERIFDRQIEQVREDVMRARTEDRLVIYLSVPISRRGGSFDSTNVDIAMATERRLYNRWGDGVWILNPARFQMESKGGYGLIQKHASSLGIDLEALLKHGGPLGGDYMRMWTQILVMDGAKNLGGYFDGYYFLGPDDVAAYFDFASNSGTTAVHRYFASRFCTDAGFRYHFSKTDDVDWGGRAAVAAGKPQPDEARFTPDEWKPLDDWETQRKDFLRFYLLRASGNFSRGCHDEWNIWVLLNRLRLKATRSGDGNLKGEVGNLIPAFYDGRQVDPATSLLLSSDGYGTVTEHP